MVQQQPLGVAGSPPSSKPATRQHGTIGVGGMPLHSAGADAVTPGTVATAATFPSWGEKGEGSPRWSSNAAPTPPPPPPPQRLLQRLEIKVVPDVEAGGVAAGLEDGGRLSPPPQYKATPALPTPTTMCASVASLDDSRSPILPVRVDMVGLGYDPKGTAPAAAASLSPRSPAAPPGKDTAVMAAGSLILQGVTASLNSGELVAVMGPSGSGKSTLLRLIHGDHRYLRGMRGSVLVNGTPVQAMHAAWRQLCSLVPQEDVLLGSFTVHETMLFSAHLRLRPQRTLAEKEEVVAAILADLGMQDCANVKVEAISGGQRRRVSVGLELIVNPSVLILDEPTSGLDSKTAEDICLLLKALSKPGRLVVCSIHQPSFRIFSSFSRLCFLVKGRLAYAGPFSHVMPYFESLRFLVPTYENPSDYYMRIMQTEGPALTDAWAKAAPPITYPSLASAGSSNGGKPATSPLGRLSASLWKTSAAAIAEQEPGADASSSPSTAGRAGVVVAWDPQGKWLQAPEAKSRRAQSTASGWQQYRVLLHRFLADSYKDKGKMLSGVLMEGTIGLLIGLVWYQQDVHDSGSAFAVAGVFIMLTTIAIFDNCVSVGLKFPLTRALHFREFSNGYYRLAPYYLASVTSSLLLSATYQLVQALLVFFLVGFDFTPAKFLGYLLVLALAAGMGAFLGFIVGTHTSDLKRTQELLTPILMPMIVFSGYMLPLPQLPSYLRFFYYASFYQYVFSSLMILHFSGLEFDPCTFRNPFCVRHGEDYLEILGLDPSMLTRNLAICAGFLAFLILVGYWSLRRVSL